MGNERGLPSIPRGLGRELTTYLQALHGILLSLSGLSRGSDRALRVSDVSVRTGTATASIGQAAVLNRHLAPSSVTDKAIQAGAVTDAALAAGAVTVSKLGAGVLPVWVAGTARDGETVSLPGVWAAAPLVAVTAFTLPGGQAEEQADAPARVGVADLREVAGEGGEGTGQWEFDAAGNFEWAAIGYTQ